MQAKLSSLLFAPIVWIAIAGAFRTGVQQGAKAAEVVPESLRLALAGEDPPFSSELAKKARREYRRALRAADKAQLAAYEAARKKFMTVLDAEAKRALGDKNFEEALALRVAMRDLAGRVANKVEVERLFRRVTAGKYQEFEWKAGQPHVQMLGVEEGFCYLSGFSGAFEGSGESVGVYRKNGKWMLGGTSAQRSVRLRAIAVRFRRP